MTNYWTSRLENISYKPLRKEHIQLSLKVAAKIWKKKFRITQQPHIWWIVYRRLLFEHKNVDKCLVWKSYVTNSHFWYTNTSENDAMNKTVMNNKVVCYCRANGESEVVGRWKSCSHSQLCSTEHCKNISFTFCLLILCYR